MDRGPAARREQPTGPRAPRGGSRAWRRLRRGAAQRRGVPHRLPRRLPGRFLPRPGQPPPGRPGDRLDRRRLRREGADHPRAVRRGGPERRGRGEAPRHPPLRRRCRRRIPPLRPTPGRQQRIRAVRAHPRLGHELHLGHHGTAARNPPAAARQAPRGDLPRRLPRHLRDQAVRRQRPPGLLTALPHRRAAVRRRVPAHRAPPGADGQVGAPGHAGPDRRAPLHPHPHGADPVPPAARAARAHARGLRRELDAARHPRRRPLPRPRQARDDRLVGRLRRGVLRRERGRRRVRHRGGLAQEARHGRQGVADQ